MLLHQDIIITFIALSPRANAINKCEHGVYKEFILHSTQYVLIKPQVCTALSDLLHCNSLEVENNVIFTRL